MKKAKIVITYFDHQTNRISIRNGEKGKGKEIWGCNYWFDSDKSVEQMNLMLALKLQLLSFCGFTIFDECGEFIDFDRDIE